MAASCGIDRTLVVGAGDVARTIRRAAALRGEQFLGRIGNADEDEAQVQKGSHERENGRLLAAVKASG